MNPLSVLTTTVLYIVLLLIIISYYKSNENYELIIYVLTGLFLCILLFLLYIKEGFLTDLGQSLETNNDFSNQCKLNTTLNTHYRDLDENKVKDPSRIGDLQEAINISMDKRYLNDLDITTDINAKSWCGNEVDNKN